MREKIMAYYGKRGILFMILTTILFIVLAVIATLLITIAVTGGAVFLGVFGDLIVFGLIVTGIVKLIKHFKRK